MSNTHPLIMDICNRMGQEDHLTIFEKPDALLVIRKMWFYREFWFAAVYIPAVRLPDDIQHDLQAANPQFITEDTDMLGFSDPAWVAPRTTLLFEERNGIKSVAWGIDYTYHNPALTPHDVPYMVWNVNTFGYRDVKLGVENLYNTINPMLLPLPEQDNTDT